MLLHYERGQCVAEWLRLYETLLARKPPQESVEGKSTPENPKNPTTTKSEKTTAGKLT